ncbi:hypothetical protein K1T71_012754 [Dendrolimus kikuchii]|uniref:Uncharacterized protein n=1 Tax=Dendrolimus kikuchii TaxID=765133 RepID=A0ACC1CK74_9NEOP|nr:hypothetical protein K1T71_012754 [Dendrolimus kikuchii]
MSLLEDVFLEDEAGEAERLERVIEGDEYEEVQNAQEDKRRVDPTKPKRVVKNPRFVLNPARLTGPRGIQVIPDHFKDFKFKGKGHEKEDLDMVLKNLEHWAYRLYPKFEFSDCLKKIETLGKKRPVMVHLHKIRTDHYKSDEVVEQKDSSDDESAQKPEEDEFDKLLQEQIELARATPAPASVKKPAFATPIPDRSLSMPKATSSPSINDEQRERMLRNRRLAEERRLAKLNKTQEHTINNIEQENNITDMEVTSPDIQMTQVTNTNKEVSKFNVNESPDTSDSETEMPSVNQFVVADIHDKIMNKANKTDSKTNQVAHDRNTEEISNYCNVNNNSRFLNQPSGANEETVDQSNGSTKERKDFNCNNRIDDMVAEIVETNIIENRGENDNLNIGKSSNTNLNEQTDLITESIKISGIEIHDKEDVILNNMNVASYLNNENNTINKVLDKLNDSEEVAVSMIEKHTNLDQSGVNINSTKHKDKNKDICEVLNVDFKPVDNEERALTEEEIMDLDFSDDF